MATNTTNSFTNHTGNNTAGPFSISFDYLAESEVVVTVGGVTKTQTTHYTFPSATTISFTSGNHPANSAVIKFQRNTSVSSKKVDFQDGSVLTEADLDSNTNQLLYGFQELLDDGPITESDLLDEDNMASNSATKAATQQSIKAYVDANDGTTNLSYTAGTRELASSSGTNVNLPEATTSNAGLQSSSDKTKLDGIEASATADQTAAEIRTLVESATDSNVFTDADHTKLNAIEASATADQTDAEIRTAVEAASDSNVFTDADHTKLNGIAASANNYSISSDLLDEDNMASNSATKAASQQSIKAYVDGATGTATNLSATANGTSLTVESSSGNNVSLPAATTSAWGVMSDDDKTKLDGIETSATADQTGAQIKTAYEAESDTNAYTDAEKTKLSGIEASATADQTNAEIRAAVEAATDSNVFTDADHTKLNAIEASADVTDATNVNAAGAVMNSDLATKGQILIGDGSGDPSALSVGTNNYVLTADSSEATGIKWAAAASGGISNVVEDTTPQLGGNLDVQAREITTSTANGNIVLNPNGEFGVVRIKGDSTNTVDGTLELRCSSDSHGVKIKSPPHSAAQNYTLTLPSSIVNGAFLKTDSNGGLSFATPTDTNTQLSNAEVRTAVEAASDSNVFTDADHTKLNAIAASANNYVHPNHSGEVTSTADGATVIADNIVDEANLKVSNTPTNGYVLTAQSGNTGGLTWAAASGGGLSSDAQGNTVGGSNAGDSFSGTDPEFNTLIGKDAGTATTTGDSNSAFGYQALKENTTGTQNACFGYQALDANTTGSYNCAFGYGALGIAVAARYNVAVGMQAANATTGEYNVAVGANALYSNTTGEDNVAIGREAQFAASTGKNIAIGTQALQTNTANKNVGIGHHAGNSITTGSNLTCIGYNADASAADATNEITLGDTNITKFRIPGLNFNLKDTTATDNYVLTVDANGDCGWEAAAGGGLSSDTRRNTVAGTNAGDSFHGTNDADNTVFGYDAGTAIVSGTKNTFLGAYAGAASDDRTENVFIGYKAGYVCDAGIETTLIGSQAGVALTGSNERNTFVGQKAGEVATTTENSSAFGRRAGSGLTTGDQNTFLGASSGWSTTTGSNISTLGYGAVASSATVSNEITLGNTSVTKFRIPGINFVIKDTTATDNYVLTVDANGEAGWEAAAAGGGLSSDAQGNTVAGTNAGTWFFGTTAQNNTYYGKDAGRFTTTGDYNLAIGAYALTNNTTASNNTAVGYEALNDNTTGTYNVAVGSKALDACTTGHENVGLGYMALSNVSTGSSNVAIGKECAKNISTGGSNIAIGRETLNGLSTGEYNIALGASALYFVTGDQNIGIGKDAGDVITSGENNVCIGYQADASSATVDNEITLGNSSIATLRCQVTSITALSDRRDKTDINTLDLGLDFINSLKPVKFKWDSREGIAKDGTYEAGFIAQDFQQVQKDNDADYLGLVLESNPEKLEATPGKLIPILVKAIQELKMEVETLKNNG